MFPICNVHICWLGRLKRLKFLHSLYYSACVASYSGHSQFFNVARWKTRGPGRWSHVTDVKGRTMVEPWLSCVGTMHLCGKLLRHAYGWAKYHGREFSGHACAKRFVHDCSWPVKPSSPKTDTFSSQAPFRRFYESVSILHDLPRSRLDWSTKPSFPRLHAKFSVDSISLVSLSFKAME